MPGVRYRQLRDPADLILTLLDELTKLVGDALGLHLENLAAQSPDVWLSIGLEQLAICGYFLGRSLAGDVGLGGSDFGRTNGEANAEAGQGQRRHGSVSGFLPQHIVDPLLQERFRS